MKHFPIVLRITSLKLFKLTIKTIIHKTFLTLTHFYSIHSHFSVTTPVNFHYNAKTEMSVTHRFSLHTHTHICRYVHAHYNFKFDFI